MAKSRAIIIWCVFATLLWAGWLFAETQLYYYTNFTAGELTRKLDARQDFERFFSGAREITNLIVSPFGGVFKRPGTKYVATASDGTNQVRLIPMQVSDTLGYIIEMGHNYMRFYSDHGIIVGGVDANTDLLLHMNMGEGSKAVVDYGDTGHTITSVAAQTEGDTNEFSLKFGVSHAKNDRSPLSNVTGVTLPDHADYFMDAGNATIDFWINFNDLDNKEIFSLFHQYNTTDDDWVDLFYSKSLNKIYFKIIDNGTEVVTMDGSWTPSNDTWYHIAVIRGWGGNANDWAITVNGTAIATVTDASSWIDINGSFVVADSVELPVNGRLSGWPYGGPDVASGVRKYIDEFRLSDIARWTADFSGSLPAAEYSSDGNTVMLCHFNSSLCGTARDATYTYLSTSQTKFGSNSVYMDSTSNKDVGVISATDPEQGTGEFTIEMWVYFEGGLGSNDIVGLFHDYNASNNEWVDLFYSSATDKLYFEIIESGATTVTLSGAWNPGTGTWYHIAAIRGWNGNANDWAITVDGVPVGTVTSTTATWSFNDGTCVIGDEYVSPAGYSANGSFDFAIDEFRVSKSVARWTATFSVPTVEYPYDGDGGGAASGALEIATVYDADDLFDIDFAQSIDEIYFAHPSYEPQKLTRSSHTSWAIATFNPANDPWTAVDDYPSCVEFHEERLCFAATNDEPNSIWMSKSGDFADFGLGAAAADDGLKITLASSQLNRIQWMQTGTVLAVGTLGSEWAIGPMSSVEPITPSNIQGKKHTTHGSSRINPVGIGRRIIFSHRTRRQLRDFAYNWEADSWKSNELSLLSSHILSKNPAKEMSYQEEPNSTVWVVTQNGALNGMTYNQAHKIIAWHHHETEGDFESIATITNAEGKDEIWVVVERTVGGVTDKYIEYFMSKEEDSATDGFYVDCGLSYNGDATTTITGADHLETETVAVLADGLYVGTKTIVDGGFTLDTAASVVHMGLPYTAKLETLSLPPRTGTTRRIKRIVPRFYATGQAKWGYTKEGTDNLDTIDFSNVLTDLGLSSGDLFTGEIELNYDRGWGINQTIIFQSDEPLPFTLSGILIYFD